ncbi:MAG: hypothetical protein ACJA2W_000159 [Planctomycetota bacterium]|jgi:hypothetical protein
MGAVVAPLLAGLGIFGLGDAELTARAQLEREARARVGGLQSQWSERLKGTAQVARTMGEVLTLTDDQRPLASAPMAASTEEQVAAASLARLLLLSARADFGAGEPERALKQCRRAIETSRVAAGEALLLAMQIAFHIGEDSTSGSQLLIDTADAVSYRATIDGTSGRLLALLTAAPLLDAPTRDTAAVALAHALKEGRVALPDPAGDHVALTADGWRFYGDPWWTALEEACEERLGAARIDWRAAFQQDQIDRHGSSDSGGCFRHAPPAGRLDPIDCDYLDQRQQGPYPP